MAPDDPAIGRRIRRLVLFLKEKVSKKLVILQQTHQAPVQNGFCMTAPA